MNIDFKADLHNHTNYSDGILTPEELIIQAKQNNVDVIAVTDHDTVLGISEAFRYGKEYGVKVIAGIELSTYSNDESIHIIGLFKDNIIPDFFTHFSHEFINTRKNRAIKMMQNIKEIFNVNIDLDNLLGMSQTITRGNMIRSLQHSNPTLSYEKIVSFINNDSKAYIPVGKISTKEGIKLLHDNNAIAILAHPTLIRKNNILELLSLGFNGLEARYSKNQPGQEQLYINYAKDLNILISAGSDCHGDNSHGSVGDIYLNEEEFLKIAKVMDFKEQ